MAKELFGERRSNLEEEFFAKHNRELLERIRKEGERESRRGEISRVSGITDENVLDRLVDLEISEETLVAFFLVPLVAVAWADGEVDDKEHEAVLEGARESGLDEDEIAFQLLDGWLHHKPAPRLMETWKEYVLALGETMEPEEYASLKKDVLGRARKVAEAAGGFLGLGRKVSAVEEKVLAELERAFG